MALTIDYSFDKRLSNPIKKIVSLGQSRQSEEGVQLLRIVRRVGPQRRFLVDDPAVDTVRRSRCTQMRVAAAVLGLAVAFVLAVRRGLICESSVIKER